MGGGVLFPKPPAELASAIVHTGERPTKKTPKKTNKQVYYPFCFMHKRENHTHTPVLEDGKSALVFLAHTHAHTHARTHNTAIHLQVVVKTPCSTSIPPSSWRIPQIPSLDFFHLSFLWRFITFYPSFLSSAPPPQLPSTPPPFFVFLVVSPLFLAVFLVQKNVLTRCQQKVPPLPKNTKTKKQKQTPLSLPTGAPSLSPPPPPTHPTTLFSSVVKPTL